MHRIHPAWVLPVAVLALAACDGDEEPAGSGATDAGGPTCEAVCTHIVEAACPHEKSLAECIASCENVAAGVPEKCQPDWEAYQACRLAAKLGCEDAGQSITVCTTALEKVNACYSG